MVTYQQTYNWFDKKKSIIINFFNDEIFVRLFVFFNIYLYFR